MSEDISKILIQRATDITKNWKCPECGVKKIASIELFLLENDKILECIICKSCGNDDHNARLRMNLNFGYDVNKE